MRFLNHASLSVRATFVVLNKHDIVSLEDRPKVIAYAERIIADVITDKVCKIFSLSARDGLAAKQANDTNGLRDSGLLDFEKQLVAFLTEYKSALFMDSMCDRVSAEVSAEMRPEFAELLNDIAALKSRVHFCTSCPILLTQFADKLRSVALQGCTAERMDQALPTLPCPACSVRWSAEDGAIKALLARRAKAYHRNTWRSRQYSFPA